MYRIFLSSPSDVKPERDAVSRIVAALNAGLPPEDRFELLAWEREYYTADSTFQDQIPPASACDLVICIFWKRLGSPLPESYRRADGSLPTGTEFEFEDALGKATQSTPRTPDVLVYRKMAKVFFDAEQVSAEQEQRERFLQFWRRWFQNEAGHFAAAFHHFDETADFEALIADHLRRWLANRNPPGQWKGGSPFRGLAAFDVDDADVFFGRDRAVDRARARLIANAQNGCRFLLIQGPSGSGKSSLARAGILARLRVGTGAQGVCPLSRYATVTPAALRNAGHWTDALAKAFFAETACGIELALGDSTTSADLAALMRASPQAACVALTRALERAGDTGLCLLVDQLEEILRWPVTERTEFATLLAVLTQSDRMFVIATMRSEFNAELMRCVAFRDLARVDAVQDPQQPVPLFEAMPPAPADMRDIIERPARLAGLTYAPAQDCGQSLAARIEAEAVAGGLPALQYLLSALYEQRDGNMMTHQAYDALGGITGVLAARGNAVLDAQPAQIAAKFPALVRRLVDINSADAPPVARDIARDSITDPETQTLVATLSDAGLLRIRGDGLRFAHEVLLMGWDRVSNVLAAERRYFFIRAALFQALARHKAAAKESAHTADSGLLTGLALAEAQDLRAAWGADTLESAAPGVAAFIDRSALAARRNRARKRGTIVAAGLAVIAAAAGLFWQDTQRQRAQLTAALQSQIAEISQLALQGRDWDHAAAALGQLDDPAATVRTRSLAFSVVRERAAPEFVAKVTGDFTAVRFDHNGVLATLTKAGALTRGGQTVQLPPISRFRVDYFDLHMRPDGNAIIITSDGHFLHVPAGSDQPTTLFERHNYFFSRTAYDVMDTAGDFTIITPAAQSQSADIVTCGAKTLTCNTTSVGQGAEYASLSADGTRLAIAKGGKVSVFDTSTPNTVTLETIPLPEVTALEWAGNTLYSGTRFGGMFQMLPKIQKPSSKVPITFIKRDTTSDQIAYLCDRDILCIEDLRAAPDTAPRLIYGMSSYPVDVAWHPNGNQLATLHADGAYQIWDLSARQPEKADWYHIAKNRPRLAIDTDDGRAALGGWSGSLLFLTPAPGKLRNVASAFPNAILDLSFSENGTLGAVTENGDLVQVARGDTSEPYKAKGGERPLRVTWQGDTLVATYAKGLVFWPKGATAQGLQDQTLAANTAIGGLVAYRDDIIFSRSDGALMRWNSGAPTLALPLEHSADSQSALTLDLHPDNRHLVTTRADNEIRIYDLEKDQPPLRLKIDATGTRFAEFSPRGQYVAALDSADQLTIWSFDADSGTGQIYISIDPVPLTFDDDPDASQIGDIAWSGPDSLALTTASGALLTLDLAWDRVAKALQTKNPPDANRK